MLRINDSIIKKIETLDSKEDMKEFLRWVLSYVRDNTGDGQVDLECRRQVEQKLNSYFGDNITVDEDK